jgi:hypothetical protein
VPGEIPTEVEVSLEQELGGAAGRPPRRLRVSARYVPAATSSDGSGERLPDLVRRLREELDQLGAEEGGGAADRPDRTLDELIGTYRPRQAELVELLRSEGEITAGEYDSLRAYLQGPVLLPASTRLPGEPTGEPPVTQRPIAAAPLAQDRTPTTPRPVDQLLSTYRIESVKQAGAVRARRQISYEEYMSLRRHFQASDPPGSAAVASEREATDSRE